MSCCQSTSSRLLKISPEYADPARRSISATTILGASWRTESSSRFGGRRSAAESWRSCFRKIAALPSSSLSKTIRRDPQKKPGRLWAIFILQYLWVLLTDFYDFYNTTIRMINEQGWNKLYQPPHSRVKYEQVQFCKKLHFLLTSSNKKDIGMIWFSDG